MNHNVFINGFTIYRSNDTKYYDIDENRFLMATDCGSSRFFYFVVNNRADNTHLYYKNYAKSISQDKLDQMVLKKWKTQLAQQAE